MENYNELMKQINPDTSDEVFASGIIGKAEASRKRRSGAFKSIYGLTAIIAVFGFAGIAAGLAWHGGYLGAGGDIEIIEETREEEPVFTAEPILTTNVNIIYADEYFLTAEIIFTYDQPVFETGKNYDISYELYEQGFLGNLGSLITERESLSVVSENEMRLLFGRLMSVRKLSEGEEFTVCFTDKGDADGNKLFQDAVEVSFVIGALETEKSLALYPNHTLENGNILKEIRISPYGFLLFFDGIEYTESHDDEFYKKGDLWYLAAYGEGEIKYTSNRISKGWADECLIDAENNTSAIFYSGFPLEPNINPRGIRRLSYNGEEIELGKENGERIQIFGIDELSAEPEIHDFLKNLIVTDETVISVGIDKERIYVIYSLGSVFSVEFNDPFSLDKRILDAIMASENFSAGDYINR